MLESIRTTTAPFLEKAKVYTTNTVNVIMDELKPISAALILDEHDFNQEIQETGGNIAICALGFFRQQWCLLNLVHAIRPITTVQQLSISSIHTALYLLGKTPVLDFLEGPVVENRHTSIKPIITKIRPYVEALKPHIPTVQKVATFAIYIAMFNSGFIATPTIGLFLLSVRLIKNNTDLITDKVQDIIDITTSFILIAAVFTKQTMWERAFLIANLAMSTSGFFLASIISSYLACGKTHAVEKDTLLHNSPNKLPLETILHHPRRIRLNIDASHYPAVPEDLTVYGLSQANPMEEYITNFDELIAEFRSKIGEEKYFEKMLRLYKNQQDLSAKDLEKLTLLEQAWANALSDEKLKDAERELSGLTEDKIAQITQWEAAIERNLDHLPEDSPIRPRLEASKKAAIEGLEEHKQFLENFKVPNDTKSIKENMEKRKDYYRDFFVTKFVFVLEQLKAGNFTQGGTIKTDVVKKEMSFVLNAIQHDLASDDPIDHDNALGNFTQLIERCHFCNSGMTESLRTLRIQMNTFAEDEKDTIKNQIYYILQLHREHQSKILVKECLATIEETMKERITSLPDSLQGYFSTDVHPIKGGMAYYNTKLNFAKDADIEILSTQEYYFAHTTNLIGNHLSNGKISQTVANFINPRDIMEKIHQQMQISEPFRSRVMEWKKQYVTDLSNSNPTLASELNQVTYEKLLVQLLLIDTGVLKVTES